MSVEYYLNLYKGTLSENDIEDLLNKGRNILIKCLELLKAFLSEKDKDKRKKNKNDKATEKIYSLLVLQKSESKSSYKEEKSGNL